MILWQTRWGEADCGSRGFAACASNICTAIPVKGLTAEALEAAEVEEGGAIPWDRAFALAQGDAGFDPAAPGLAAEGQLHVPEAATRGSPLLRSMFEPRSGMLAIRAPDGSAVVENALTAAGRERIGALPGRGIWGRKRAASRGSTTCPATCSATSAGQVVSLINLASLARLRGAGRRRGATGGGSAPMSGSPAPRAWAELDWVGQKLQLGGAVLRVTKRITRCAATEVNP